MTLKKMGLKKAIGPDRIPIEIQMFGRERNRLVALFLQQNLEKQQDAIGVEEKYDNPFIQE